MNETYSPQIRAIVSQRARALGIHGPVTRVEVKHLGMGENNLNLLVIVNKTEKFVFRLGLKDRLARVMRREFRILRSLPPGIAPRAFSLDLSRKQLPRPFIILSYVEGRSPRRWTRPLLRVFATTVAALHRKRYVHWETDDRRGKRFDLLKNIDHYAGIFKNVRKERSVQRLLPRVRAFVADRNSLFLRLTEFSLVHGDIYADNILVSRGRFFLIDWEWCSIRDPAEDLARGYCLGLSAPPWYQTMTRAQWDFLLAQYAARAKINARDLHAFKERVVAWHLVIIFFDYVYFLWKLKHWKSEPSRLPRSHYVRTARRLERYLTDLLDGSISFGNI